MCACVCVCACVRACACMHASVCVCVWDVGVGVWVSNIQSATHMPGVARRAIHIRRRILLATPGPRKEGRSMCVCVCVRACVRACMRACVCDKTLT